LKKPFTLYGDINHQEKKIKFMTFIQKTCASLTTTLSTAFASSAISSWAPGLEIAGFNIIEIVKFLPFIAIFYYFLIHQPKKKAKEHQEILSALKKGDKIVTSGGIFGVIYKIETNNNEVLIEIAENVRVEILKSAISPVTPSSKTTHAQQAQASKTIASKKETKDPVKKLKKVATS
jgi:preprotein translocase subunit YajC